MGERFGSGSRRRGRPAKQKTPDTGSEALGTEAPDSPQEGECPLCADGSVAFATPTGKLAHETRSGLVFCSATCDGCLAQVPTFKTPGGVIVHETEAGVSKCRTPGLAKLDPVPTASQASIQPQGGQRPTGGPGDPNDGRSGHPGSVVSPETPPLARGEGIIPPKGDERNTW